METMNISISLHATTAEIVTFLIMLPLLARRAASALIVLGSELADTGYWIRRTMTQQNCIC